MTTWQRPWPTSIKILLYQIRYLEHGQRCMLKNTTVPLLPNIPKDIDEDLAKRNLSLSHLHVSSMLVPPFFNGREFLSQVGIKRVTSGNNALNTMREETTPSKMLISLMFRKAQATHLLMRPPTDSQTVSGERLPVKKKPSKYLTFRLNRCLP